MSVRQERDDDGLVVLSNRSSRDHDDDDEEDDDHNRTQQQHHQREKQNLEVGGCEGSKTTRAKHLLYFPLRKFRNLYSRSKKGKRKTPLPPPSSLPPLSPLSYLDNIGDGKGCYLCFMDPRLVPPAAGSASDEPNKPPSSYNDLLRSMIEKNDFYSPECNPHRSPERSKI